MNRFKIKHLLLQVVPLFRILIQALIEIDNDYSHFLFPQASALCPATNAAFKSENRMLPRADLWDKNKMELKILVSLRQTGFFGSLISFRARQLLVLLHIYRLVIYCKSRLECNTNLDLLRCRLPSLQGDHHHHRRQINLC